MTPALAVIVAWAVPPLGDSPFVTNHTTARETRLGPFRTTRRRTQTALAATLGSSASRRCDMIAVRPAIQRPSRLKRHLVCRTER